MTFFSHSIAILVMAECACAGLIFTSFIDVPSLAYANPIEVFELVHFLQRFSNDPYLCRWSWLDAFDEKNFAFIGAVYALFIASSRYLQSFSELLISSAKRSSSDGWTIDDSFF